MTAFFMQTLSITAAMSVLIAVLFVLSRIAGAKFTAKCRYIIWAVVILRLAVPISLGEGWLVQVELPAEETLAEEVQNVTPETQLIAKLTPPETTDHATAFDFGQNADTSVKFPTVAPDDLQTVEIVPENIPELTETLPEMQAEPIVPKEPIPEKKPVKLTDILNIAAQVYVIGVVAYITVRIVSHIIYINTVNRTKKRVSQKLYEEYHALCDSMKIRRHPALYSCEMADSPMLCGYFHPRVILPPSVAEDERVRGILAHELTHYKRGDIWLKLIAMLAEAIHWFNPLVHFASRRCEQEMELACDEAVLCKMDEDARVTYGYAMLDIVKMCAGRRNTLTTQYSPRKAALKERFENILDTSHKRRGVLIIVLSVILCAAASLAISCTVETPETVDDESSQLEDESEGIDKLEDAKESKESLNDELADLIEQYTVERENQLAYLGELNIEYRNNHERIAEVQSEYDAYLASDDPPKDVGNELRAKLDALIQNEKDILTILYAVEEQAAESRWMIMALEERLNTGDETASPDTLTDTSSDREFPENAQPLVNIISNDGGLNINTVIVPLPNVENTGYRSFRLDDRYSIYLTYGYTTDEKNNIVSYNNVNLYVVDALNADIVASMKSNSLLAEPELPTQISYTENGCILYGVSVDKGKYTVHNACSVEREDDSISLSTFTITKISDSELFPLYESIVKSPGGTYYAAVVTEEGWVNSGVDIITASDGSAKRILQNNDTDNAQTAVGYTPVAFLDETHLVYTITGWEHFGGYGIYDITTGETNVVSGYNRPYGVYDGALYVAEINDGEFDYEYRSVRIWKVTADGEKTLAASTDAGDGVKLLEMDEYFTYEGDMWRFFQTGMINGYGYNGEDSRMTAILYSPDLTEKLAEVEFADSGSRFVENFITCGNSVTVVVPAVAEQAETAETTADDLINVISNDGGMLTNAVVLPMYGEDSSYRSFRFDDRYSIYLTYGYTTDEKNSITSYSNIRLYIIDGQSGKIAYQTALETEYLPDWISYTENGCRLHGASVEDGVYTMHCGYLVEQTDSGFSVTEAKFEHLPYNETICRTPTSGVYAAEVIEDGSGDGGIDIIYPDGTVKRILENIIIEEVDKIQINELNRVEYDISDVRGYTPIGFLDDEHLVYAIGGWEWHFGYGIYNITTGETVLSGKEAPLAVHDGVLFLEDSEIVSDGSYETLSSKFYAVTVDGEKKLIASTDEADGVFVLPMDKYTVFEGSTWQMFATGRCNGWNHSDVASDYMTVEVYSPDFSEKLAEIEYPHNYTLVENFITVGNSVTVVVPAVVEDTAEISIPDYVKFPSADYPNMTDDVNDYKTLGVEKDSPCYQMAKEYLADADDYIVWFDGSGIHIILNRSTAEPEYKFIRETDSGDIRIVDSFSDAYHLYNRALELGHDGSSLKYQAIRAMLMSDGKFMESLTREYSGNTEELFSDFKATMHTLNMTPAGYPNDGLALTLTVEQSEIERLPVGTYTIIVNLTFDGLVIERADEDFVIKPDPTTDAEEAIWTWLRAVGIAEIPLDGDMTAEELTNFKRAVTEYACRHADGTIESVKNAVKTCFGSEDYFAAEQLMQIDDTHYGVGGHGAARHSYDWLGTTENEDGSVSVKMRFYADVNKFVKAKDIEYIIRAVGEDIYGQTIYAFEECNIVEDYGCKPYFMWT